MQNKVQQALQEAINRIQYQLITTTKRTTYAKVEKIDNTQKASGISIVFIGKESPEYLDLENDIYYQEKESFSQKFEIKDSLTHYNWQLTREKKKVLGFDCRKAIAKDGEQEITAWYAPKLPYKSGPRKITGLPGIILEMTIASNDKQKSELHLWATDVQVKDDIEIAFPTFNNSMTKEDFDKKSEEMQEKMREMQSGGVETD